MKKIFLGLICFVLAFGVKAQVTPIGSGQPIPQNIGADSAFVNIKGITGGKMVVWRFADTTAANSVPYLKNYPFSLIATTTGNLMYYRNAAATGWITFGTGGSGGTAWNVTGNIGTNPSSNFAGTIDNQLFQLRADNNTLVSLDGEFIIITQGDINGIANGTTFKVNDRDGDDGENKGIYQFNHRAFQIGTPEYVFPQSVGDDNSVLTTINVSGNKAYLAWLPMQDSSFNAPTSISVDTPSNSFCINAGVVKTCYPIAGVITTVTDSVCVTLNGTTTCYAATGTTIDHPGGLDSATKYGGTFCWYNGDIAPSPTCVELTNSANYVSDGVLSSDSNDYVFYYPGNVEAFRLPTLLQNLFPGTGIYLNDTTISGETYIAIYNTSPGSGAGWLLEGNAATSYPDNFLGTTDDNPISFRTNDVLSGYVWGNSENNTSYGYSSLQNPKDGTGNTAVGANAMQINTTGDENVSIGYLSLANNLIGNRNTALGYASLNGALSDNNTGVGALSLNDLENGLSNTAIGYSAGGAIVDGSGNTFIGNTSGALSDLSNASAIGNNAKVGLDGVMALGDSSSIAVVIGSAYTEPTTRFKVVGDGGITASFMNGNVGIGTTSPLATLHVNGTIIGSSIASGGSVTATGDASVAFGRADNNGSIVSSNGGSVAMGTSTDGLIEATGNGALAFGYAQDNTATISASGVGSWAFGYVNDAGKISANNAGSFAGGAATNPNDLVETTSEGSFTYGSTSQNNGDTVRTDAASAVTFGNDRFGSIYNNGGGSYVFGSGYTNEEQDAFTIGWGRKYFHLDTDSASLFSNLNVYGNIAATNFPIHGSFSQVGTATTTFTVTFGGTQANTTYAVNVTPTAALSAALFYVTNKTTTTFDVVYLAGLTGTVTFDYSLLPTP